MYKYVNVDVEADDAALNEDGNDDMPRALR